MAEGFRHFRPKCRLQCNGSHSIRKGDNNCFDSLSDIRSDERCEGAGKTACELLYSQSRVGVVGSQLYRAAGNTETGFSNLISIAFITAWQSFIKEGACQG